jgi:hypothetical protein
VRSPKNAPNSKNRFTPGCAKIALRNFAAVSGLLPVVVSIAYNGFSGGIDGRPIGEYWVERSLTNSARASFTSFG